MSSYIEVRKKKKEKEGCTSTESSRRLINVQIYNILDVLGNTQKSIFFEGEREIKLTCLT